MTNDSSSGHSHVHLVTYLKSLVATCAGEDAIVTHALPMLNDLARSTADQPHNPHHFEFACHPDFAAALTKLASPTSDVAANGANVVQIHALAVIAELSWHSGQNRHMFARDSALISVLSELLYSPSPPLSEAAVATIGCICSDPKSSAPDHVTQCPTLLPALLGVVARTQSVSLRGRAVAVLAILSPFIDRVGAYKVPSELVDTLASELVFPGVCESNSANITNALRVLEGLCRCETIHIPLTPALISSLRLLVSSPKHESTHITCLSVITELFRDRHHVVSPSDDPSFIPFILTILLNPSTSAHLQRKCLHLFSNAATNNSEFHSSLTHNRPLMRYLTDQMDTEGGEGGGDVGEADPCNAPAAAAMHLLNILSNGNPNLVEKFARMDLVEAIKTTAMDQSTTTAEQRNSRSGSSGSASNATSSNTIPLESDAMRDSWSTSEGTEASSAACQDGVLRVRTSAVSLLGSFASESADVHQSLSEDAPLIAMALDMLSEEDSAARSSGLSFLCDMTSPLHGHSDTSFAAHDSVLLEALKPIVCAPVSEQKAEGEVAQAWRVLANLTREAEGAALVIADKELMGAIAEGPMELSDREAACQSVLLVWHHLLLRCPADQLRSNGISLTSLLPLLMTPPCHTTPRTLATACAALCLRNSHSPGSSCPTPDPNVVDCLLGELVRASGAPVHLSSGEELLWEESECVATILALCVSQTNAALFAAQPEFWETLVHVMTHPRPRHVCGEEERPTLAQAVQLANVALTAVDGRLREVGVGPECVEELKHALTDAGNQAGEKTTAESLALLK